MTDDETMSLPTVTGPDRRVPSHVKQLAEIPEEEIWLQKQKSARTRRAYRLDVQHFMGTLSITTPAELRQADHKAVIAWGRFMRETEHAAAATIRGASRRCPLSISTSSATTTPRATRSARSNGRRSTAM